MSYPKPMSVVGRLGQYYHHAPSLHDPVTSSDIKAELNSRGYRIHVPPPIEHELPRAMAIKIAVDYTIDAFNIRYRNKGLPTIPHTRNHWYRCPSGVCYIEESQWKQVSDWAVMVANGYLNKKYGIPDWAQSMLHSGFHGLRGLGSTGFALGGFNEWSQENAWVYSLIGTALMARGQYLTSKQASQILKENIPADYLTKTDLPALLAALQQQGVIQPGQERAISAGAEQATAATPSWMMPVMIGGGALLAVLLLKK